MASFCIAGSADVFAQPTAGFSRSYPSPACEPATVLFTNTSSGIPPLSYQWQFGDGSLVDTIPNPSHLFDTCGAYIVTLTATDSFGLTDADTQVVIIACNPVTDFSMQQQPSCDTAFVSFFDETPGMVISRLWNFGDSASGELDSSSLQNPAHFFSSPGTYLISLTTTNAEGCSSADFDSVTVPAAPQALFTVSDTVVCFNDTVFFMDASASADSIVAWHYHFADEGSGEMNSDSSQNAFHIFSSPGDFSVTLTATSLTGCTDTHIELIHVNPSPPVDAGADTAICIGSTAVLHASGAVSYFWKPASSLSDSTSSSPIASPVESTTYLLNGTDSMGCTAVDSMHVTVNLPAEITFLNLSSDYCVNHDTVILVATPAGGTFSGNGVRNGTLVPSSLMADSSYLIIYTFVDSTGCSTADTAVVSIRSIPDVNISSSTEVICKNGSPVDLQLSPEGGMLAGAGITGNTFDPSLVDSAGLYLVTYTVADSNWCSNSDSIIINVLPLPVVSITSDTTICAGDSIQLSAGGGVNYLWSPSASLSSDTVANPLAFPVSHTVYTVTVVDTNQCSASDSVLVSVFSMDSADAGIDTAVCLGQGVMLDASGGSEFLWSPSAGLSDSTIANPVATPALTTTYTVTISGGACSAVDSVTITVSDLPVIEAGNDTFVCYGNSVQLLAFGGEMYLWHPDSSLNDPDVASPVASPLSSTLYFVSGIDSNNCSAFDSVWVEVKSLPFVSTSADTSICSGDTLMLHADGAASYHWTPEALVADSDSATTAAFPFTTTWFEVTGIDSFGCGDNDSVLITVTIPGNFIVSADTMVCSGNSVMLIAEGAEQYSWSPGILLNDSTISNAVATVSDTTIFILTAVSAGCTGSDTITVFTFPASLMSASDDTALCSGASATLQVSGGSNYHWTPESYLDDPQSPNPVTTPPTSITYTVTGVDANGCTAFDSVLVIVNPIPEASISADTSLCEGEFVMMVASGGEFYLWQPADDLSAPQNDSTLAYPDQTTIFTVYATDTNFCTGFASVTLTVHPPPVADAGPNVFVCNNEPVQLQASGGELYSWMPETGLSDAGISNPVATVTSDITYTVTVIDAYSCTGRDSVSLTFVSPLNASASNDTTICAGTSAQLFASGGTSYSWIPSTGLNDAAIATPVATPAITTQYTVFISDGVCDTDTLTVLVQVVPLPIVNAGADANLLSGAPYNLNPTAPEGTYQWTPENGLSCNTCLYPVATLNETTTFTLTVTVPPGCSAADEITLTVICSEDAIYVPNAFTPNNNGQNDVLLVRTLGDVDLNFFRVYDRWGHLIFETQNLSEGWDGTFHDKHMMPGAYLYEWEAVCSGGEVFRRQGNVTLLR